MYKVLIADDEYFIRYGLEHIIQWEEYGIEICGSVSNGVEAIKIIDEENPDIVITDVKMPEMDGLELLSEIRRRNELTKVVIISGYNDFDYVKKTLVYGVENYILKPIDEDELSHTILNAIDKIEKEKHEDSALREKTNYIIENVFNRLVTNSIALKEVEERFVFFGVDMKCDAYVVSLIKIIDNTEVDSYLDKGQLIKDIKAELSKKYITHIFYDLAGNVVIIFCLREGQTYDSLEDDTKNLVNFINNEASLDVFITIGSEKEDMGLIHRSYSNALSLQEYIYIYSVNTSISYNKIVSLKKRLDDYFNMNMDLLKNNILSGNRYEVERFFHELKMNAMSSKGSSLNYIRSFLIELVALLINIIKEKELWKENEVIYPDKLYEKLFGEKDLRTTISWLKDISLKIINKIEIENKKPSTMQERIIEYVEKNYNKDISLKVIASDLYINPSYLGQLFKKHTGKLFSTYLNELRVEKAKELMVNTNKKANCIAKEVGYSDSNYFYKVFKKYTGMYPSEYK